MNILIVDLQVRRMNEELVIFGHGDRLKNVFERPARWVEKGQFRMEQ